MIPVSKTRFWFIVGMISIALNIILLQRSCGGGNNVTVETRTEIVRGMIIATIKVKTFVPKIVRITLPPKEVIHVIDSVSKDSAACKELATDFYSTKEYHDTIVGDSIDLDLKLFVSKNKVDSVSPKIRVKIPYIKQIQTTIFAPVKKTPWKFYVGASIGGNQNGFLAGPELSLTDPNRMMYKLGVDFNTFGPPIYKAGVSVKLSFPKRIPR